MGATPLETLNHRFIRTNPRLTEFLSLNGLFLALTPGRRAILPYEIRRRTTRARRDRPAHSRITAGTLQIAVGEDRRKSGAVRAVGHRENQKARRRRRHHALHGNRRRSEAR